ncbi:MAG: phage portal protein [Jatrophihabitans sp.]
MDRPGTGAVRHGVRLGTPKRRRIGVPDSDIYADPAFYDAETKTARRAVQELSIQLDLRIPEIQKWQRYYDGHQPLKFATDEYRKHFGEQYAGFNDNWCAPVADTTAEKLTVAGLRLAEDSQEADSAVQRLADRDFARIWQANECPAQSSQAFTEACIAKRSFVTVWGRGDDERTPEITFDSPDEVIVGYEPGSRRRRKTALKRWTDGKYDYATLHIRDMATGVARVWKWQRERPDGSPESYTPDAIRKFQWVIRDVPSGSPVVLDNPSGVIPIIELANRPRLKDEPLSEVAGAAAMQDAINSLWSYLFTAADFRALPQRVVLGAVTPQIPVLDAEGKPTGAFRPVPMAEALNRASVARIMGFEGPDARIDQWDAADLAVFTGAIEFGVGHLAAQSRTPAHYFTGKIVNVPEGALVALAQAHISKVRERALYHSGSIKEIAAVEYLMLGEKAKAAAARGGRVMWEDFEIRPEGQMADLAIKLKQAGFSFPYIAERFISDPVELAEEIGRHNTEQAQQAALMDFGPKPAIEPGAPDDSQDVPADGAG